MPNVNEQRNGKKFYCPECSALLNREPTIGAIYFCPDCGRWFAPPGDKEAKKFLARQETADAAEERKIVRRGLLPAPVLLKVRLLTKQECANFEAQQCIPADKTCVFFAEGQAPLRCRWFERAVLPLDPVLFSMYCLEYDGTDAQNRRKAQKAAAAAKAANRRTCERCGQEFTPSGRQVICPACRRAVRREKDKQRKRAARNRG